MPTIPKLLKQGDLIGIISPAGPITKYSINDFQNGLSKIKKLGYKVLLGKFAYNDFGFLAGNDKQRAFDLNNMFKNQEVKAILCSRGGYGTERLVDYIDFDIITNNPKIFMGYSNISFLLNLFYKMSDLITFHGPVVKDLGSYDSDFSINQLFNTITTIRETHELPAFTSGDFRSLVEGRTIGRLAGGNLTTIISTMGTKFEICTKNKILLIEDVDEPAYSVDKMLTLLKNSGKLDICSGIIVGEFTNCQDSYGTSVQDVIKERLIPLRKPLICNAAIGHGQHNITLPLGALVELDATSNAITILEPVVC